MFRLNRAMYLVTAVAIMTIGLMALGGCPQQEETADPAPAAVEPVTDGEPIKIGALFAVTGPASSLGEPERDTAVMLEKYINENGGLDGREVQVIVRDTKGLETDALTAARELVEKENVLAIIGPSRSGTTLAVVDYVEQAEVALISCAAARAITDPVKKWVFQVAPGDADAVQRIYTYMGEEGISRVALLTESSGYGIEGLKQLQEQASAHSIEIVATEEYADTDTDMTTQLTRIAGTDAQAVVCWGIGKAPALVARGMGTLNMQIPLFQSSGVANARFIEAAGEHADGVIMPAAKLIVLDQLPEDEPQLAELQRYHEMFVAEYEREPDHYGGHAWDALHIVVNAIERAGVDADRTAIRDAIEGTEGFVGMGGIFTYGADNHYGLSPDSFAMVTIENGEWKLIE